MTIHSRSIAVIDSGIGGLTIVEHIRAKLPSLRIHYAADLAKFPYGLLSAEEIAERLCKLTDVIITRYAPTIVVVACNTGSTLALDKLRQTFDLPFVGVVPAIKPAAALSESGHIGILSTRATANSPYLRGLIESFAMDKQVDSYGATGLVTLAEQRFRRKGSPSQTEVQQALHLLALPPSTDTIVLACTHFPILTAELKRALPNIKHWVDSGEAIARRVRSLLDDLDLSHGMATQGGQHARNSFNLTYEVKDGRKGDLPDREGSGSEKKLPYLREEIGHRLGAFDTVALNV